MTRLRTVLACGSLLLLSSLSLSVLFISLLGREEAPVGVDLSRRYVQDSRLEPRNRNILDVHYTGEVEREEPAGTEAEEDVHSSPSHSSPSHSSPSLPEKDHVLTTVDCTGPWPGYSECEQRMEWMRLHWETDPCYAKFGVDGSNCSFQIYLSEVEFWCPRLPGRAGTTKSVPRKTAVIQHDLSPLLHELSSNVKFEWISNRIKRLWPNWSKALSTLEAEEPFVHSTSNILIHIGALSDKAGFKFAENAGRGGPLGELVQWSDLIASLFALGYNLDFSTEIGQLKNFLVVNTEGGCPSVSETKYSAIFIDIVGLKQLKKITRNRFSVYKCLVRVLDSFGTEPVFNFKKWKPQADSARNDYGRAWGNWELNPRQFMTMYPHTPDNSFLGFVVEANHLNSTPSSSPKNHNSSLVYGKELYMWEGDTTPSYLKVISKYFNVHATIGTTARKDEVLDWGIVPSFVHNYGILDGVHLTQLLRESRLFIGLGFPYEGPAPLEAIAQGCIFLNPKVNPPVNRFNSKFFAKKPTLREIDSQNPYMAMFVGKPYVYTLDSSNMVEVERTLQEILRQPRPPPYIPYEFTFEGMLERITAYLSNQKFCEPYQWPPVEVLKTRISEPDQSCKDACYSEGLVCEPELFSQLNTQAALDSNGLHCTDLKMEHSIHGPSINIRTHRCSIQLDHLLLSCAGHQENIRRLCPCREYRKGQVALCVTCSR